MKDYTILKLYLIIYFILSTTILICYINSMIKFVVNDFNNQTSIIELY